MEHHHTQQTDYLRKIKELDQATFFCFNESSQKLPVAIIRHLDFVDDNTLLFDCSYFPLVEKTWDVFAAELHCYKKGMPYSFVLHGVAIISDAATLRVTFTIQHVESFDPTVQDDGKQTILTLITWPYKYIAQMGSSIIGNIWKKEGDLNIGHAAA
jgi:hypothetical protein